MLKTGLPVTTWPVGRWRSLRLCRLLGVLACIAVLVTATAAFAAMHRVNGFYHGLKSNPEGCDRFFPSCRPEADNINDDDADFGWVRAGMYHLRDDGGWNNQCFAQNRWATWCTGEWGSQHCRKYAWTDGTDSGGNLAWHGHNSAAC